MFNSYQPNLENLQQYMNQENEKSSNQGSDITWWSFPKGMSSVRILPPWDPTGRVALPVYMHPITFKNKSGYTKYNWTCVNKTFGKPCSICDGIRGLADAGVDISDWEPNRRQFYLNAIVMHDPSPTDATPTGTHVLLRAPKTFYDWVIAQITNPMVGDLTSVTKGIDILVTKEGEGLGTSYQMTLSPNGRTAVPQEYLDNIKDLYNLDDIFSRGFDQEQIDELVDHLRKSSGAMSNSVSYMSQQMAGYAQQTPSQYTQSTGYPPVNNPMTNAPSQFMPQQAQTASIPPMQTNVNPSPAAPPAPMQTAPVQAPTPSNDANMPKCFGQYDAGNVNCVVCPQEMNCAKVKNG